MTRTLTLLLLSLVMATVVSNAALAADGDKLKVVYHVAEEDRVAFVLNNIQNHIEGVGGPEHIDVVLVAHGPAVRALNDIEAVDRVRGNVSMLQEQGVEVAICANTLKVMDMERDELLPGLVIAEQGGVTRIAELQAQGYLYLRP